VAFSSDRAERLRAVVALAALLALCACGGARPLLRPGTPEAMDYEFTLDPALTEMRARVCFRGQPPADFVSGLAGGARYLGGAWLETAGGRAPLAASAAGIDLAAAPADACIGYAIDLAAASEPGSFHVQRRGDALVTNIALWLWRPTRWREAGPVRVRFALPEQSRVLLPWPREADAYAPDHSAFAFYGYAVFGRFDVETIVAPGATLRAAVLDGFTATTRADLKSWLSRAAHTAALASGRVPGADAVVAVIPMPGSDRPVRFGMAARGGGTSLLLLVSEDASLYALARDWVAVHEFCHLLHPFVARDDAWLSEGLATYYQEVLRVRAGLLPELEAWRRLYEGSLRGRAADASLAEHSAAMFADRSFSMVYWAGASFALMADVELRRRSRGATTLDRVVSELARCCARGTEPVPARELIAQLDRIAGMPVFSELAQRWVLGPRLPDLDALYARLGLAPDAEGIEIVAGGEDAAIREAIMRGGAARDQPAASLAAGEPER
jgi:hypothetical protein